MRDLLKNTFPIWYVYPSDEPQEVMDGSLHTGEYRNVFSDPVEARISMYPATTKITDELFGKVDSVDMIASSSTLNFSKDTLIFTSEPIGEYAKTYDYSISAIAPSLNTKTYGLKKRV